jgi:hypothetical protein
LTGQRHKQLMGQQVSAVTTGDDLVRGYQHDDVLMLVNLHADRSVGVDEAGTAWVLTSTGLDGTEAFLNGEPLVFDGALPTIDGAEVETLVVPALGVGFFRR